MIVSTRLTPSQKHSIDSHSDELYGGTLITHVSKCNYTKRVRISIYCVESDFRYHLFVGVRGAIYETEDGSW